MQSEILNINYHIRLMVLKALNTSPNTFIAAKKLGVSERQVYRYKKEFSITTCRNTRRYVTPN